MSKEKIIKEQQQSEMIQDSVQAPPQKPLSIQQILVQLIIEGQANINRLVSSHEKMISIQNQQMVYINMLINSVTNGNESAQSGGTEAGQQPVTSSSTVQTQSGTIKQTESQPINN